MRTAATWLRRCDRCIVFELRCRVRRLTRWLQRRHRRAASRGALDGDPSHPLSDAARAATEGSSTPPAAVALPTTASALALANGANPFAGFVAAPMPEAAGAELFMAPVHVDAKIFITGLPAATAHGAASAAVVAVHANLSGPANESSAAMTDASVGSQGATAAQVQQAWTKAASTPTVLA